MNNQFHITPYKILNDSLDLLVVNGTIPLFQDHISVNYSLQRAPKPLMQL